MVNKRFCMGILVIVLVFGMAVVSCDDSGEPDTWTDVTNLSQLNGTWKGSFTDTETENGITIKFVIEITMTINATSATTGTVSGSSKVTVTFSGSGINDYWDEIKADYLEDVDDEEEGIVIEVNDANHSITMTETMSSETISLSEMDSVQINQNGTKLKVENEGIETIYTKQ